MISTVFLLDFGTIPTVWYFLFLISLVADAMFYLCYGYWYQYQMLSVSFNRNTACAISGAGTANNSGAPEFVFGFLRNVLWIIVWF